jgi:spore maturation protein CgeB
MRIGLLYPAQPTSNFDVAKGYAAAFRKLGHRVKEIEYHKLFMMWSEYYRFFGLIQGVEEYSYTDEDIIKSASINAIIKIMEDAPDLVVVIDGTNFHPAGWFWITKLQQLSNTKVVIVGTESPYQDRGVALVSQYADVAYTNERTSSERTGIKYLPTAYSQLKHYPTTVPDTLRHDVVFIGSGFQERIEMLSGVNWDGIDFAMWGHYPIDHDHPLAPYYKGAQIPNERAAIMYSGAKISLNLNRTSVDYDGEMHIPEAESMSPRAYEIPACGGFMISEYRPEVLDIFGDMVPVFRTSEELEHRIRYWLDREEERRELADRMRTCVHGHSYTDRAKVILQDIA